MPHADICSLEYAKNIKKWTVGGWGSVRLIAELGCRWQDDKFDFVVATTGAPVSGDSAWVLEFG